MTYGEKVKKIREKLFLTQQELASMLNVNITTVNRWETEKFEPSIKAKKLISEFCKDKGFED